jgi:hypothetical protein
MTQVAPRAGRAPATTNEPALVEWDATPQVGSRQLPKQRPNHRFLFAYREDRMTVIEGRVVPELATIELAPGVEGVGEEGWRGWRKATTRWEERGYTVIPPKLAPNGRSYVQTVKVKRGTYHHSVFTTVYAGSDRISMNADAYADWLWSLIHEERLPKPQVWAIERLRERLHLAWAVEADKAVHTPSRRPLAQRLQEQVDAVDELLEQLGGSDLAVHGEAVDFDEE